GKSTLLKILSRITRPTSGRAEIRGRVGSLLEVGTGFHSELTGRENVYLNGAVLGMSRREIDRKFDEIIDFAETERFLDTPVKRYSSGMYMRLAFAVAAHLEPEILLVDEVLAVGDMAFQQKCLGKMREVGRGGRTVLLVSHNMGTISSLCDVAMTLEGGRNTGFGKASEQVAAYIASLNENSQMPLASRTDRSGTGRARITRVRFVDPAGRPVDQILSGDPVSICLDYTTAGDVPDPSIHVALYNDLGAPVTFLSNIYSGDPLPRLPQQGSLVCQVPQLPLAPGSYLVNVCLQSEGRDADHIAGAAQLSVNPGGFFRSGRTPPASFGYFLCQHQWLLAPAPTGDRPVKAAAESETP
ncbi:MAG: ABC transporter ATP-binding protein, partial [Pirellulales bacterium]